MEDIFFPKLTAVYISFKVNIPPEKTGNALQDQHIYSVTRESTCKSMKCNQYPWSVLNHE